MLPIFFHDINNTKYCVAQKQQCKDAIVDDPKCKVFYLLERSVLTNKPNKVILGQKFWFLALEGIVAFTSYGIDWRSN